eukprot:scaffold88041_cov48-Phaeocystis_antarctica.AAC.1
MWGSAARGRSLTDGGRELTKGVDRERGEGGVASKGAICGVLGAYQLPYRQPQPVLERGVAGRIPFEQRLPRLAP